MKLKKMFTKAAALALTGAALLATSCSDLLDTTESGGAQGSKATVRFADATARTIKSSFTQTDYIYTLTAVSGEETWYLGADGTTGTTATTALDPVSYSTLTGATSGWQFTAGTYTFTLDAYKESTRVLTASDTKTLTAGGTSSLSFALAGISASDLTGSVSITFDYSTAAEKANVTSAKAVLGATVAGDAAATSDGLALDTTAFTATYTNSAVPAATEQYLTVFFYGADGTLKGYKTASIYVYADDSLTQTVTVSALNQDKYPYVIYSEDFTDVTDATTVFSKTGGSVAIATENPLSTAAGNYFTFIGESNTKYATMDESLLHIPTTGGYIVEWDASLYAEPNYTNSITFYTASGNLFVLTLPTAQKTAPAAGYTCTINGESTTSVNLTLGSLRTNSGWTVQDSAWYHYKLVVDIDSETATIAITDTTGEAVLEETALAITGTSYVLKGISIASRVQFASPTCLDNIVVRSASDVAAFTTAASISGESSATATGEVSLTASAAASYVAQQTEAPVTYAWSITSGASYASLSAASGESVTLTGANSTINNQTVTVSVTATAEEVTSTATKNVTVAADQSLLSAVSFTGTAASSVNAGGTLSLTASGAEKAASVSEDATVSWSWTTSDESVATVSAGDTAGTATVSVLSTAAAGSTATIRATATLGSITKYAEYTVTALQVLGSGSATISGDSETAAYGTITATATVGGTVPDGVTTSCSWSIPTETAGVSINSTTGVLTSTNTTETAVIVQAEISADGYQTITQTGSITVPAAAYLTGASLSPNAIESALNKIATQDFAVSATTNVSALSYSWAVYTDEACTTLAESTLAAITASESNAANATLSVTNNTSSEVTLYVKATVSATDTTLGLTAVSATVAVPVSNVSYVTTEVSGVTIAASSSAIAYNGSTTLTATVNSNGATVTSYVWTVTGNATLAATEDGTYGTSATTTAPTVYLKAANTGVESTASVSVAITYSGITASADGASFTEFTDGSAESAEACTVTLGAAPGTVSGITVTSVVSGDVAITQGTGDAALTFTAGAASGSSLDLTNASYAWYLDRAAVEEATSAELDLSGTSLSAGYHYITAIVTVESHVYTAQATISVTE